MILVHLFLKNFLCNSFNFSGNTSMRFMSVFIGLFDQHLLGQALKLEGPVTLIFPKGF